MCNRDNVCDIVACPDEKSMKRNEPKNQAQIKIIRDKTHLNNFKKYLTTFQVVILCESSCKSTYCNSLNPCKL